MPAKKQSKKKTAKKKIAKKAAPKATKKTMGITDKPNGNAIAALILGIIAVLTIIIPGLGLIIGILALIFGILARKHEASKGYGLAGIIMGGVVILIQVFIIVVVLIFAGKVADDPSGAMKSFTGLEGCETDGNNILCEDYTYGTNSLTLTLTGDQMISSAEAEVLSEDQETTTCTWQGRAQLTGTGEAITLACEGAVKDNSVATFNINWNKDGTTQKTTGMVLP